VGVVDSGIDALHPAFAGRILRVWDQTANGPGVPEGNFGQELFGNAMSISHDTVGHGTHVAGIAAGAHPVFEGVAPRADLVIVKSTLQDAHIADGVSYIFRVAQDMNRPAVVNLSLGGHFDSHDGADSVCQVLDSLTGPGRIICCAAGNEGNDNIHGQANLSPGNSRRMRFIVPGGLSAAQLNGWYSGASRVEVAVRTPGNFVTPFQAVNPASPVQNYALADARVRINTPGPDFTNNDHNFRVVLRGPAPGTPVRPGLWQLLLRHAGGPATVADVWTLDGLPSPQMVFTGTSVKDSMKVGSPGAARSAVTVAAFTTKIAWQDINGVGCQVGLALNDIADFSSEGPLRNGVQKPDVAAPGAMIASALSRHSAPNAASVVNPDFLVEAGTSMATPFVTGLAALLLERNRNLDPAGVKALLNANSRVPNSAPGAFNPKWGRGLIDANNL
jgi:subtilisin family serine protease